MSISKRVFRLISLFLVLILGLLSHTDFSWTYAERRDETSQPTIYSKNNRYSTGEHFKIEVEKKPDHCSELHYDEENIILSSIEEDYELSVTVYTFQSWQQGAYVFRLTDTLTDSEELTFETDLTIVIVDELPLEPISTQETISISFNPLISVDQASIYDSQPITIYQLDTLVGNERNYKLEVQTLGETIPDYELMEDDAGNDLLLFHTVEDIESVLIVLLDPDTEQLLSNKLYLEVKSSSIQLAHVYQPAIGEITGAQGEIKEIAAEIFEASWNIAEISFVPATTGKIIQLDWIKVVNTSGNPVEQWVGDSGVYTVGSYSSPIYDWNTLLFRFNPKTPGTYKVYLEYEENGSLVRSNELIFKIIAEEVQWADYLPSQAVQNNLSNLWEYNAFIDGYHSTNGADVEGPVAIVQDSNFPTVSDAFSYAASFLNRNNTVGLPIPENEDTLYLGVLIQGKINNFSQPRINPTVESRTSSYAAPRNTRGWLVGTDETGTDINQWLTEALGENFTAVPYMLSNTEMTAKMNQLRKERASYQYYFDSIEKRGTSGFFTGGGVAFSELGFIPEALPIYYTNQPGVYLVDLDEAASVSNGFVNSVTLPEELIKNEATKQILVTSKTATKVAFNGSSKGYKGKDGSGSVILPNIWDDFAKEIAMKVTYYFPEATQITNYLSSEGSFPTVTSREGIDSLGNDQYSKDKEIQTDIRFYAAVLGDILAPAATTVFKSGSLNGSIYVRDFHQREGMEIHYFYSSWPSEDVSTPTVVIEKTNAENNQELLEGAEFVLFRQNVQNQKEFFTDNGFWVVSEHNDTENLSALGVKFWKTDERGKIEIDGLIADTYYLLEMKPPDGYLLPESESGRITMFQLSEEQISSGLYFLNIQNIKAEEVVPETENEVIIEKTNKLDGTGLEAAEFILVNEANQPLDQQFLPAASENDIVFYRSSEDGSITLKDIPDGTYKIIEVSAPTGYLLSEEAIQFKVVSGKLESENLFNFSALNTIDFQILLTEQNLSIHEIDGTALPTELLTIPAENRRSVSVNLALLEIGQIYYITYRNGDAEPLRAYFKLAEDVGIRNLKQVIAFQNEKLTGELLLEKRDRDNEILLEGAVFQLYNETGELLNEHYEPAETETLFVTDAQGKILFTGIPDGIYCLREKTPPVNYLLSSENDFYFEVREGQLVIDQQNYPNVKDEAVAIMLIYNERMGLLPDTGASGGHIHLLVSLLSFFSGGSIILYAVSQKSEMKGCDE